MNGQERPETAFALSLAAGVLMLVGGGVSSLWFMSGGIGSGGMMGRSDGMMGGWGGMMGGWGGMMGGVGVPAGFMGGLSLLGLASGILVTVGAVMLNTRPAEHSTWGTIILVFSILSLLGMGGFFIGAVLGIIGGALAISWRPAARSSP